MSDQSTRLNLPFIAPAQAQKHVTHNEALVLLDALVQTSVTEFGVNTPPVSVQEGAIYGVGTAPTGDWVGQADMLAVRQGEGWVFVTPQDGWRAWDQGATVLRVYSGGAWASVAGGGGAGETNNLDGIGIGTTWDATNRLSVTADATLLSHAGTNHQIKINKASTPDTASLLFQSGWTGHAEMGLAGDNAWSIKVSDDGAVWDQPLSIDAAGQLITANYPIAGTAVQQSADDTTPGRLMRAEWGYSAGNLIGPVSETSGTPTGAVIERGETVNGHYTRWADGTQLCWIALDLVYNSARRLGTVWQFPMPFGGPTVPSVSANIQNENSATPDAEDLTGPIARQISADILTHATVRIYRRTGAADFAAADTMPAQAMAIGRWY